MNRTSLLSWVVLGWLWIQATAGAAPPNVVMIVSDDHAWTDYGFMGHPELRTPHLDRLARESLCFTRGYVPSSLCCPSLASIITGLYPHQHRVVCNDPPVPAGMARADIYRSEAFRAGRRRLAEFLGQADPLPSRLGRAGYLSFQSGKWWQGDYRSGGFTHGMTRGEAAAGGGRHGDEGLEIGRKTLQPIYDFVAEATGAGKPFLVWYAPMMPHDPHTPPERLLERYRQVAPSVAVARYWAMVEWFDETVGALLNHLEHAGLAGNTLVVYVADNGWITDPRTGRFAPRSKQSPYDGGLRTPILLRWPGRIAPRRVAVPVSSVDLAPTILRAAGLEPGDRMPGIDLGRAESMRGRGPVFGACFTHDAVDLEQPAAGLRWRWIVAGDWKLIVPNPEVETGPFELYRVGRDPLEKENLATSQGRRVERMRALLDAWWSGR